MRFHEFGAPHSLRAGDVPRPQPAAGELLIEMAASSVNPVDWQLGEGRARGRLELPLPFTPGMDFSGVVRELGSGISDFAIGDRVFGAQYIARSGAYAEFLTAPATVVSKAPKSMPLHTAAAVPLAALTAWQVTFSSEHANLQPGQRVLIQGGAGGTGMFAVQFARNRGAHVIATASAANQAFLRSLGAHEAIDYNHARPDGFLGSLDAVIDLVGGDVALRSIPLLRKGAVLASIVPDATLPEREALAATFGVRSTCVDMSVLRQPGALQDIARLIDGGNIEVVVSRSYPLAEAGTALAVSRQGHARGKVLLAVNATLQ